MSNSWQTIELRDLLKVVCVGYFGALLLIATLLSVIYLFGGSISVDGNSSGELVIDYSFGLKFAFYLTLSIANSLLAFVFGRYVLKIIIRYCMTQDR